MLKNGSSTRNANGACALYRPMKARISLYKGNRGSRDSKKTSPNFQHGGVAVASGGVEPVFPEKFQKSSHAAAYFQKAVAATRPDGKHFLQQPGFLRQRKGSARTVIPMIVLQGCLTSIPHAPTIGSMDGKSKMAHRERFLSGGPVTPVRARQGRLGPGRIRRKTRLPRWRKECGCED